MRWLLCKYLMELELEPLEAPTDNPINWKVFW